MPRHAVIGQRPPAFVSRATLAAELDIGESTVDDLVRRGQLPKPVRIGGSVRWSWATVEASLLAMTDGAATQAGDPFMKAIGNETAA